MRPPSTARLAAALAGLALITACAAAPAPKTKQAARPPTASALDGCFTAASGTIEQVPDATGGNLTLATLGTGPRVVVLSNQSDENLCSWLPVSARLAKAGYRVVLWDYGGNSPPDDLAALVKSLRTSGATRLVLMGASEGAKTSLIAGARITPRVQGVVSLSAEAVLSPAIPVVGYVRHLRCPLLLVTAIQDPFGSAQAARQFLAAAPGPAKSRLVTVPGTDHGTALLAGQSAAKTLPAILAFLHGALS